MSVIVYDFKKLCLLNKYIYNMTMRLQSYRNFQNFDALP